MGILAAQQQALLAALWRPRHAQALETAAPYLVPDAHTLRGLQAYRSNGHELAVRVLQAAFPVLAQLLDEDNFPMPENSLESERSAASIGLNYNPLTDWENVTQPVLLIHGEKDNLSPHDQKADLSAAHPRAACCQ